MHRIFCALLLFQIFTAVLGRSSSHLFSPIISGQKSPSGSKSIIHGTEVKVNEIKYIVGLYYWSHKKLKWRYTCGGGIIGKRHVLTAAHCILSERNRFIMPGFFVMAGITFFYEKNIESLGVQVRKAYLLKDYKPGKHYSEKYKSEHFITGDIAVLQLNGDIDLNSNTKLNLPPANTKETYEGVEALIAGFDDDRITLKIILERKDYTRNTSNSGKLHKLSVIVGDFASKKAPKQYSFCHPPENYICAVLNQNITHGGACDGDSGSPLVYNNTVIGIVSVGSDFCDQRWSPEAYTRVSTYVDFIDDAMNDRNTDSMRIYEWPIYV